MIFVIICIVLQYEFSQRVYKNLIIEDYNIPLFLTKDICNVLEKLKGIYQNDTLGGKQNMITISEEGVYISKIEIPIIKI